MGVEIDRVHLIPWYSQNCAQGEAFTVDGDFKLKTKARHSFSIKACQGLKGAHFELLFVGAFKIFDEHDNLMSLFTISAARRRARLKKRKYRFFDHKIGRLRYLVFLVLQNCLEELKNKSCRLGSGAGAAAFAKETISACSSITATQENCEVWWLFYLVEY